jgi:putative ABC transport system permease protein
MLENYFKTALRNLTKHKVFSFINIFGLAIGIAACLMILQYVRFEWSYDNFHQKGDRIYRVQQDRYDDGKLSTQWAAGAAGIGPAVMAEVPEVEAFAKLSRTGGVISYGSKQWREDRMYYANDDFLPMFSYPILKGRVKGALAEPNTAVLTRSAAKKYFGSEDPIGKTISRNRNEDYKVTAVVADMPPNTHLKFDVLLSFITYVHRTSADAETGFNWDGFYTYLLLKPGTDAASVQNKITRVAAKRNDPEGKSKTITIDLKLQPLKSIHLSSNFMSEAEVNGNGKSVSFLLVIAVFIIIIAWINYINLSTAKALERAKEVGVRKVMGSYRGQLVRQFLFEALMINLLAVALGLFFVAISLPLFNLLTGKEISFSLFRDAGFWLAVACIFFAGSIFSGMYPAFVLSSFRPIEVLKGRLTTGRHGSWLRQSLVIFQFAASVALMVGTYSVYRQLQFMNNQELGVQIDQTLVVRGPSVTDSTYAKKLKAFKTEMLRLPGVQRVTASTEVPGNKVGWNAGGIRLVGTDPDKASQFRVFGIDDDFTPAYGLEVKKGRAFSPQMASDSDAVMFNEAAVATLGYKSGDEILNKQIEFWGDVYTIIGIVGNHHQESLRENYDAYIYRYIPESDNFYSLKMAAGKHDWQSLISATKTQWEAFFPGNPFEYFFLDDHFQEQYEADRQFGRTFGLFAVLAIIVACLGLFGLVSFVTAQRTKEIGIRKIAGARVSNILLLLTKNFIRPILVSFAIATPVTYYLLTRWLEDYAFKIDISPWLFILPALLILVLALVTISMQTVRVANANPVKSLRTE